MQIRLARGDEIDAVAALTVRCYVEGGFVGPDDAYVSQLRDVAGRAATAQVWVATAGERLLGAVTWCPDGSPWRELAGPGEGEFRTLVVDPEARGRGVGEMLVRHCLDLSRAAGHAEVVLCTMDRMLDAQRLYERLGFERDPALDWTPAPGVCLWAFRRPH